MLASQAAERWDEDFECQLSPAKPQLSSPAAPARTSSPLSSLSWAESDTEDATHQLDQSFSGESAEGTEGENGTRVVRKRMKGAWDDDPAGSHEVEMASPPATLRRTLFPSGPAPPPVRPSMPGQHLSFGSADTSIHEGHFTPPALFPSPTFLDSSSPAPHLLGGGGDDQPSRPAPSASIRPSKRQSTLGISVSPPPEAVTMAEFLRGDGKPRRRLRKRSRVGERPLSSGLDVDSDDEMQGDGLDRQREPADAADRSGPSSSPRQIISRGMSSLQRTFSVSKGKAPDGGLPPGTRQPRSPPSPKAALRRISGFMESRNPVGPPPLTLQPSSSSSTLRRGSMPAVSAAPAPPSGLQRTPSQTYSVSGFHLPTRRGSSSTASTSSTKPTSPKIRPKAVVHPPLGVPSALMPPPPMPTSTASRPQPVHSQSAPRPSAASQHPRRPQFQDGAGGQSRSASSSADMRAHDGSIRPASRASNSSVVPRKGHRTSSSVNSIPLETPQLYDKPLPSVVGSPFDPAAPLPPLPALQTYELQRSVSTPAAGPNQARRNSLSDLRIPPRVASAQRALREKVGVVKEFAARVEDLKRLQTRHAELQLTLLQRAPRPLAFAPSKHADHAAPPPSPRLPPSILRNNSGERPAHANESSSSLPVDRFQQWWEMAEVLIKLAGTGLDVAPAADADAHRISSGSINSERARAITMLSRSSRIEPPATPPGMTAGPPRASPERWRGSTGRTDLSQRQLDVLRGMLTTPVSKSAIVRGGGGGGPPRDPADDRGGLPVHSTSFVDPPAGTPLLPSDREPVQQRRASRAGVKGLKDFLRSLKIGADYPSQDLALADGKRSVSDSMATGRSTGGGSTMATTAETSIGSAATRKSPRRPSLASIFRFGKEGSGERRAKSKGGPRSQASGSRTDVSLPPGPNDDSDWERMSVDSLRPTTPGTPSGRSTSHSTYRTLVGPNRRRPGTPPPVPPLPSSSSIPARSAPPNPPAEWPSSRLRPSDVPPPDDYGTLEITPENLEPLLLYVREVERNCTQCLREMSVQVDGQRSISGEVSGRGG